MRELGYESKRLHDEALASSAVLEDAERHLLQARARVEAAQRRASDARRDAHSAAVAAKASPGGLHGDPSSLASDILAGVDGHSPVVLTQVVMLLQEPIFVKMAQLAQLLRLTRSGLGVWRQAVQEAVRSFVTPEIIMMYSRHWGPRIIRALEGVIRLGSAQQASWALQALTTNDRVVNPTHGPTNTRMATAIRRTAMPRLRVLLTEKPIQPAGLYAARLLHLMSVHSVEARFEVSQLLGRDARLVKKHGGPVGIDAFPPPAPPPLNTTQVIYTIAEVNALPDDARMHIYLYGTAVDRTGAHRNDGSRSSPWHPNGVGSTTGIPLPRRPHWITWPPSEPPPNDENLMFRQPVDEIVTYRLPRELATPTG